jgi:hypothetical protein
MEKRKTAIFEFCARMIGSGVKRGSKTKIRNSQNHLEGVSTICQIFGFRVKKMEKRKTAIFEFSARMIGSGVKRGSKTKIRNSQNHL